jgi:hypothetical protein
MLALSCLGFAEDPGDGHGYALTLEKVRTARENLNNDQVANHS